MAEGIRIVVVIGSMRPGNYTSMAVALVADELRKRPQVSVEVIDPATLHLPFPGTATDAEGTRLLREKISGATGVVLATPEYHGSFSSVMKLVIENLGFPSHAQPRAVARLTCLKGEWAGCVRGVWLASMTLLLVEQTELLECPKSKP